MLADKPRFADIAESFIEFVSGAELIIHNADFDIGFLDHEFKTAGLESTRVSSVCSVIDTLLMAREIHPGQRNSLDALCKRYDVDNSGRDYHGALLDAQLLADVYLAMTGGQGAFVLERDSATQNSANGAAGALDRRGLELEVRTASRQELEAHARQMDLIDEQAENGALWNKLDA